MRRSRKTESEEKVADLTPMLDVVFIMLIFFIVTATFIKETGVEVNRPDTQTAELKNGVLAGWCRIRQWYLDRQKEGRHTQCSPFDGAASC